MVEPPGEQTLVISAADTVELRLSSRVQSAFTHGGVVDISSPAYLGKYNVAFRIYGYIDNNTPLLLDRISGTGETSGTNGTAVQIK